MHRYNLVALRGHSIVDWLSLSSDKLGCLNCLDEIVCDWQRNGDGIVKMANGNIYEGQVKDGLRHGKGKYFWVDGGEYDGDWWADAPHGEGKMIYKDGSEYNGSWLFGKLHGKGVLEYNDGIYDGEFKDGLRHGRGKYTCTLANSNVEYDGWWLADTPNGKGKMIYGDGCNYVKVVERDGDKYVGEFKDGLRHGRGKYTSANGKVYDESWVNSVPVSFDVRFLGMFVTMFSFIGFIEWLFPQLKNASVMVSLLLGSICLAGSVALFFSNDDILFVD